MGKTYNKKVIKRKFKRTYNKKGENPEIVKDEKPEDVKIEPKEVKIEPKEVKIEPKEVKRDKKD